MGWIVPCAVIIVFEERKSGMVQVDEEVTENESHNKDFIWFICFIFLINLDLVFFGEDLRLQSDSLF